MMKGHVKIELFDHKTGERETRELKNMLTNALACRAGIDTNDLLNLYSSEYSIMPLGTKGLGGLLMFDGPLTEDAGNIHFPMGVHLTGCAGRGAGNRRTRAIMYEDGEFRCDISSYATGSWAMSKMCGYVTDDLRMYSSDYVYSDACQNYIGTVCNLDAPVTKTDTQSLKITYTITDA